MSLQKLVEISNYYGANPDFVLAGGGNTSYKTDDFLYIKGSGTTLATITADGFVKMDISALKKIWDTEFSSDEAERERQVLADLMAARCAGEENKRPSVETSLHQLFPQSFVVHTHPALINGLTCAKDGEAWAKKIFGDDVIWIQPTKPGYILAATVRGEMDAYKTRMGRDANIVFLANHGIFIAGNTLDEIKTATAGVVSAITPYIQRKPDFTPIQRSAALPHVDGVALLECNAELERYIADSAAFAPVASVFTPDHMVYYRIPAFAEDMDSVDTAKRAVAVRGIGLVAMESNEKSAQIIVDLFNDTMKIAAYAESFGGGAFMPDWLIDFITNWEAESYRKSVNS